MVKRNRFRHDSVTCTQNTDLNFNSTTKIYIGEILGNNHFDGIMVIYTFGIGLTEQLIHHLLLEKQIVQLANGKLKTSPSVSYGTNGFFILKDGNSVTDQSSNSNNFAVEGGNLTNTEDCPSNIFATFNYNANNANFTFSRGTTVSHEG